MTDLANVSGSEFKSDDEYRNLLNYSISLHTHLQVDEKTMSVLFKRYGNNTEQIIALAETFRDKINDPYLRLSLGELKYGIDQEMVCHISDF